MTAYIVPLLILTILIAGLFNKVDVFSEFIAGAREGLNSAVSILPSLVALMTCVGIFKASGGIDVIVHAIKPLLSSLAIPPEIVPLALIRPISGSGALCIFQDILAQYGADSFIGRVASVLMGSTETTFYTIAIYFGSTGIKKSRHTLPCALAGDFTGFILSSIIVSLFLR